MCLHETKRFRCRPGAALSFGKIKLSRSPAPGDKCKHHHTRNEDNSTTPDGHQCNVGKVITNVHRRCQGRRECWIKLNERLLGKECVREVKYILVNYTCDRGELRTWTRFSCCKRCNIETNITSLNSHENSRSTIAEMKLEEKVVPVSQVHEITQPVLCAVKRVKPNLIVFIPDYLRKLSF